MINHLANQNLTASNFANSRDARVQNYAGAIHFRDQSVEDQDYSHAASAQTAGDDQNFERISGALIVARDSEESNGMHIETGGYAFKHKGQEVEAYAKGYVKQGKRVATTKNAGQRDVVRRFGNLSPTNAGYLERMQKG